jgi:iron complex outermembrane recepter protein
MSIQSSIFVLAAVYITVLAAPALAQTGEPPGNTARPASQSPTVLEDVIITARKREESLQNVPVVANVLTQQVLERTKTDDLFKVATQVPGLLLGNTVVAVGTQVSIRGIGATSVNPTMDQSVSLNIDGMSLSQGIAYGVGMFDVAQVEVLKGPQALFFGKNNTAGVISLRSADPTDRREGIVRIGYEGEASQKQADLIISGPVSDTLKLRLAARYSDQDGYFTNTAVATPGLGGRTPEFRNFAPTRETTARGTALWTPNSDFTLRLKLAYNDYKMDGGATPLQMAYCPDGTGGVPPVNISFLAGDDCKANHYLGLTWFDPAAWDGLLKGGKPYQDQSQFIGSLEMNYQPTEHLTLTSVTGYYDMDFFSQHVGSAASTTTTNVGQTTFNDRNLTQELRLTSNFTDSKVNFMLGAFYQDGQMENTTRLPGNQFLGLPAMLQYVLNVVDIRAYSFFGQMLWDITPKLQFAGGARWTDEKREHTEYNYNLPQGPIGPVTLPDPKISSSNVSPELSLTYKPTDGLMTFASYRTGFKSGSFNGASFQPSNRLSSFSDEEAKGGEVGIKTRSADNRLKANVAVYIYKFTDLQVGANEVSNLGNGNFVSIQRTLNAASATTKGVDLDVSYSPAAVDGLTLTAAVNYNHARYDSFPNAPCGNNQTISQGCNQLLNPATGRYTSQDLSGRRLVRAPEWSSYVGIDHQLNLANNMVLGMGAGANYTSEYSTTLVDLPGFQQDAYVKIDANVSLKRNDNKWEVALIGRNLTDETTRAVCFNSNSQNGGVLGGQINGAATGGPAGGDEAACAVERGREVWGRFSWKF